MWQMIKEMLIAFGQVILAALIITIIVVCIFVGLFATAKSLQKAVDKLSRTYRSK